MKTRIPSWFDYSLSPTDITMDDIFDNILNSKNRDNEKRGRDDILEDKERKRVDIEEE